MNLAAGSIGMVMDGLAGVFGGMDKVKEGKLGGAWDMIKGLGTFVGGIVGLKALGYLLNPFSLISDIMSKDLPTVGINETISEAILVMTEKKYGCVIVCNHKNLLSLFLKMDLNTQVIFLPL